MSHFEKLMYVYYFISQNMKHINGIVSVLLCNKPESVPLKQDQLVPMETVVLPYICSQGKF